MENVLKWMIIVNNNVLVGFGKKKMKPLCRNHYLWLVHCFPAVSLGIIRLFLRFGQKHKGHIRLCIISCIFTILDSLKPIYFHTFVQSVSALAHCRSLTEDFFSSQLIFEKEGVYLHINAKRSIQETSIPGFIRIVERVGRSAER